MRTFLKINIFFLLLFYLCINVNADSDQKPSFKIDKKTAKLLKKISAKYKNLNSYSDHEKIRLTFVSKGLQHFNDVETTFSFQRANKAKYSLQQEDTLINITSDGANVYQHVLPQNKYSSIPSPANFDGFKKALLQFKLDKLAYFNMIITSDDVYNALTEDVKEVIRMDDAEIDGKKYYLLSFKKVGADLEITVDKKTYMITNMIFGIYDMPLYVLYQRGVELNPDGQQYQLLKSQKIMVSTVIENINTKPIFSDDHFNYQVSESSVRDDAFFGNIKTPEKSKDKLIGKKAPDFKLRTFGNQEVSLKDFKDKIVILGFWKSDVPACKNLLSVLQTIYKVAKNKEIIILSINSETDIDNVYQYMKGNNFLLPVLLDDYRQASAAYNIEVIPTLFIINTDGKIYKIYKGFTADIEESLNKDLIKLTTVEE